MYYDVAGPVVGGLALPPPFHIDFVPSGGADLDRIHPVEALPLAQLYFCDGCSRIVSRRDLAEDVDSYFCPDCLENMPSSEAMLYGMRCSKCWECPVCGCKLTMCAAASKDAAAPGQTYYLACSYCRWSSKSWLEAAQPEQLITKVPALERDGELKQRMTTLVECFRGRAQEQHRERELAQRLVRRSTIARSSFAANALGSFAARRFSSAIINSRGGRSPRGQAAADLLEKPAAGHWRMEFLEEKLERRLAARFDIRFEARAKATLAAAASAKAKEEGAKAKEEGAKAKEEGASASTGLATGVDSQPKAESPLHFSPKASMSQTMRPSPFGSASGAAGGTASVGPPPFPVLNGLTVDELLQAHTKKVEGCDLEKQQLSLAETLQAQLNATDGRPSLMLQLQQISHGYQRLHPPAQASEGILRTAVAQLEAPATHNHLWELLPIRKPLLTKRSRRCRLPSKGELEGRAKFADEQNKPCGKIVVKPQINPCSNPPFQKNNIAVAFVPKFSAFLWKAAGKDAVIAGTPGQDALRVAGLAAGEACEAIFIMANPLDTAVEVSLDPSVFNAVAEQGVAAPKVAKLVASCPLASEQNVEVLTKAFTTEIDRLDDLSDVGDQLTAETEKTKDLRAKDDVQVIPQRKFHKILIRVSFRRPAEHKDPEFAPWVFFASLKLVFEHASIKHEVSSFVRFAAPLAPPKRPVTTAEAQRGQIDASTQP
eukprot:TRINITY_DN40763_c0_g1_i1.p1 TRINITY_DN40763_c0_g1~~TRINITY_DN40763_c0_g1_i1.p1  ORF type:complete len:715 (+),score=124.79 TRINITY_DN40763_c0_g1_i1:129-2273(+)